MYSILTRNSPAPGCGTGPSSIEKFSRLTMPAGRCVSLTIRLLIDVPPIDCRKFAVAGRITRS